MHGIVARVSRRAKRVAERHVARAHFLRLVELVEIARGRRAQLGRRLSVVGHGMLDSATGGHRAPSSHDVAISPSPSFGEYELGDDRLCLEQSQPWLERRIGRSWLAEPVVVVIWAAEHAFAPLLTGDGGLDLVFAGYRVVSVLPFLAVWTVLYDAFGRRVLPIMVARWVFNGGSALGRSIWSNDDAIRSGWRNHDQVVPYRGTGGPFLR